MILMILAVTCCDSLSAVSVSARVSSVRRGEFKSFMPIWDIVSRDASATEQNHIECTFLSHSSCPPRFVSFVLKRRSYKFPIVMPYPLETNISLYYMENHNLFMGRLM